MIPLCAKNDISQIVWSPLAQGVLTGKYKPGSQPPSGSRAASSSMGGFLSEELLNDRVLSAVQNLVPIAKEAGLTLAQLALAWLAGNPIVGSVIAGATSAEQVAQNAFAGDIKLSSADLAEIDACAPGPGALSDARRGSELSN